MRAVVEAGLARHIGFTGLGDSAAVREVVRAEPYETVQTYFNVLNPSAGFTGHDGGQQDFEGLIDTAARAGRGVIVIRVLAAGAAAAEPVRAANAGDPGAGLVSGGSYAADVERASRQCWSAIRRSTSSNKPSSTPSAAPSARAPSAARSSSAPDV
jgi:aryl-alcohol dehydrogenase-like predicted oxidoreductase